MHRGGCLAFGEVRWSFVDLVSDSDCNGRADDPVFGFVPLMMIGYNK